MSETLEDLVDELFKNSEEARKITERIDKLIDEISKKVKESE